MKRARAHGRRKDKGAALILVLWGATVMSVIAAASAREASQMATAANASAELTRARALAEAGVRVAWNAWSDEDVTPDAPHLTCRIDDGGLVLTVRSETAKADLNVSSEPLLKALFQAAGADEMRSQRLAAAILDYRDGDSERTDYGAERADYEAAGLGWRPRDGAFEAVEELGYIPGMDAALYRRVRHDVTVHSGTSEIDAESASPLMRAALDSYASGISDPDLGASPAPSSGVQGSRVSRSSRASPRAPSAQRARIVGIRALGVTGSGAVFVQEAIVRAPSQQADAPRLLRVTQGRLAPDEVLPDLTVAPACASGPAIN